MLRSRPGELARSAIQALRPGFSVGAGPVRVESRPRFEERTQRLVMGLLDLPVNLFERTGKRTLVAFDEFQALLSVNPGIDGLFAVASSVMAMPPATFSPARIRD